MAAVTNIEWCDSTVNAWDGCTENGPGCNNCYAKAMNTWLHKGENWGPRAPRRKHGDAWKLQVRSWQRNAGKFAREHAGRAAGPRRLVFVNSTGDTFDNEVPDEWRTEIWDEIRNAPDVVFILVTKRIGNAKRMLPADWGDGWRNVIILITVCNQEEADRDIPKLLALPAWKRGLSVEPMLGPIDLSFTTVAERLRVAKAHKESGSAEPRLDVVQMLNWVICGGESGPQARPMHPDWARSLRDQCDRAGTPFLFKQWGEWFPRDLMDRDQKSSTENHPWQRLDYTVSGTVRVGKKAAGRLLDGIEHNGFPT